MWLYWPVLLIALVLFLWISFLAILVAHFPIILGGFALACLTVGAANRRRGRIRRTTAYKRTHTNDTRR